MCGAGGFMVFYGSLVESCLRSKIRAGPDLKAQNTAGVTEGLSNPLRQPGCTTASTQGLSMLFGRRTLPSTPTANMDELMLLLLLILN